MSNAISFDRAELAAALSMVAKVPPWRRSARSPSLIMIDCDGAGAADIVSANLDMNIRVAVACSPVKARMFVALSPIMGAVNKTPASAELWFEANGTTTTVKAGRARYRFDGTAFDFGPVRPLVEGEAGSIVASALRSALDATRPATVDDRKRPLLGGIALRDVGSGVVAAAMDGSRIHAAAIFPDALAKLLISALPDDGLVRLNIGRRGVELAFANVFLSSTLIEGEYPAYAQQMRPGFNAVMRARADTLLSDLDLVATVASLKDRDVRLDLAGECLASAFRRSSDGYEAGSVTLIASYKGPPLAIGFQMRFVTDALRLFAEHPIEWRMGGPHNPTVISSPAQPGVEAIVLPFMLAADHQRRVA